MTDSYLYDSFGNILLAGSTTNEFKYVGLLGYCYDSDIQSYYLRAREYAPRRAALYLLTHWFVRTAALMARCTRTSMRTTIPLWSLIQPAYSVSPVSMSPDRVPSSLRLACSSWQCTAARPLPEIVPGNHGRGDQCQECNSRAGLLTATDLHRRGGYPDPDPSAYFPPAQGNQSVARFVLLQMGASLHYYNGFERYG